MPFKALVDRFLISIHALREEGDRVEWIAEATTSAFLSTPSARRATLRERPAGAPQAISIHALREEGDGNAAGVLVELHKFLSTPSARRATSSAPMEPEAILDFYPRPPRGGRRPYASRICRSLIFLSTPSARRATHDLHPVRHNLEYFYPRPPRGGRRLSY